MAERGEEPPGELPAGIVLVPPPWSHHVAQHI
jgi:hypothetical protein